MRFDPDFFVPLWSSTRQQRKSIGVFPTVQIVSMTRQVHSYINSHAKSNTKAANGTVAVTVDEVDPSTDPGRWRLLDDRGRQTWHYLETDEEVEKWPQSLADRHFLGLPLVGLHLHTASMSVANERPASRTYQTYLPPAHHWLLQTTPCLSYLSFSYRQAIGAASMAGPCSSSQVWLSHGT